MDKHVEQVLVNYIYEIGSFKLKRKYAMRYPNYFRQQSYSVWAAREVLEYIRHHPETSPIKATQEFIHKMDEFSCAGHADQNDSFIFSVAYDIATDMLDTLLAMSHF